MSFSYLKHCHQLVNKISVIIHHSWSIIIFYPCPIIPSKICYYIHHSSPLPPPPSPFLTVPIYPIKLKKMRSSVSLVRLDPVCTPPPPPWHYICCTFYMLIYTYFVHIYFVVMLWLKDTFLILDS